MKRTSDSDSTYIEKKKKKTSLFYMTLKDNNTHCFYN